MLTCGVFCATEDGVDPWSSGCWLVVTNNQLLVDNTEAAVESNSNQLWKSIPCHNQPTPTPVQVISGVSFLSICHWCVQFALHSKNYDLKNTSSSCCTRGNFRPVPLHILRHTCTKRWPCNEYTYKHKKFDQRNDKGTISSSHGVTSYDAFWTLFLGTSSK